MALHVSVQLVVSLGFGDAMSDHAFTFALHKPTDLALTIHLLSPSNNAGFYLIQAVTRASKINSSFFRVSHTDEELRSETTSPTTEYPGTFHSLNDVWVTAAPLKVKI